MYFLTTAVKGRGKLLRMITLASDSELLRPFGEKIISQKRTEMTICHGQVRRSKNIQIVKSLSPGPFFKKNLGDSKKVKI